MKGGTDGLSALAPLPYLARHSRQHMLDTCISPQLRRHRPRVIEDSLINSSQDKQIEGYKKLFAA